MRGRRLCCARSAAHWRAFWRSGGAVDFTGSTDPRAAELERRVVLSQYLTAIQCGGDVPPQESGLTCSTWYGKHHTEMIWWHTAHFALWGRPALPGAQPRLVRARAAGGARASRRAAACSGARWPKMIGPDGRESPGGNPLIVWNQPHPIHLAELLYRADPDAGDARAVPRTRVRNRGRMASMLHWDDGKRERYVLGPPLWIAQEIHDPATSMNPAYELAYWRAALEIAQTWRERLGLPRDARLGRRARAAVRRCRVKDGKYVALESHPDTWDNVDSRHDHPSFLMALGPAARAPASTARPWNGRWTPCSRNGTGRRRSGAGTTR